jgi:hypothetical protein
MISDHIQHILGLSFVNSLNARSWEQWHLRVVVNNTPRPVSDDSAAVIERQRIQVRMKVSLCQNDWPQSHHALSLYLQDTAEGMLRSVLTKVYEIAGSSIDHVPPGKSLSFKDSSVFCYCEVSYINCQNPTVMYEFEISCSKKVDDRENVYSRVTNMPNLININF